MMRAVNIAVTFVLLCCNVRVGALKPNLSISSFCAGNTYDVDAKKDDTVGGVCSALCKVNKLNANKQSVLYDGRVLDKKKTLQQLGVADGESLSIEPTRDLKLKSVRKEGIKRQPKTLLKKSSYQHRNEDLSKPTSRNNRVGNIKKPSESTWDLSGLRRMIQRGIGNPMGKKSYKREGELFAGMASALKSNPMDVISDTLGKGYLENILGSDSSLEILRQQVKQNSKQLDAMIPDFSAQMSLLVNSPEAFKAALQLAATQMKTMKKKM